MTRNSEIVSVASVDEFRERLPRVGHGILGLFIPLNTKEFEPYVKHLAKRCSKDSTYRLRYDDIPPSVEELANVVAKQNDFKRPKSRMIGSTRVFGNTHRHSGAHIDTNVENGASNMPLLGSWVQFNGASSVHLREITSFDPAEMQEQIESLRMNTDDPDYELRVKIRPEHEIDFARIDAVGPYFGTWAIGMSKPQGVHTVLHEIRQIGEQNRLSANLIQCFTNRSI